MNPAAIRKIDVWVGKPLCFALTGLRRLGSLLPRGNAPGPIKKILLIKIIEQGATVLAYRAIERAVELVGRENVYFLVFQDNRFILDLLDLIPPENVLIIRGARRATLFGDLLRIPLRARQLGIDATVDMEFFSRASAILAFLIGASRRVGLHRFTSEGPYRGDLMTHRMQYNPYLHTAVSYYLLVEALHADPAEIPVVKSPIPRIDFSPPMFKPDPNEVLRVRETLNRLAGKHVEGPIVLLNPNASDLLPLRKWPTHNFVELGRRILAAHPEVTLLLTGAPSEARAVQEVAAQVSPKAISVAGETTLRELIVLYTMADVLVTNDSGPGHFASMTKITAIVLFGPETPALFAPLGTGTRIVRRDLACSPCVNAFNHRFSPCNNNLCMQGITVDEVYECVRDRIERRNQPHLTVLSPARARDSCPS